MRRHIRRLVRTWRRLSNRASKVFYGFMGVIVMQFMTIEGTTYDIHSTTFILSQKERGRVEKDCLRH